MSPPVPDSWAKVFKMPGDYPERLAKNDGDTNWLIPTPGLGDLPAAV